jgi:hypothetical protein
MLESSAIRSLHSDVFPLINARKGQVEPFHTVSFIRQKSAWGIQAEAQNEKHGH